MRLVSALVAISLLLIPAANAQSTRSSARPSRLSPEATGVYELDKNHASIIFKVSHLGYSDYIGRFNNFDARLNLNAANLPASVVEATIQPGSVDTNNKELEDKLRGDTYFNVSQFPEVKFTSTQIKQIASNKGIITGDLTMLGITKSVALNVTFKQAGMNPYASVYTIGFEATGTFKRSDFGMKTLVPQIGDEVQLLIEAEFHRKS